MSSLNKMSNQKNKNYLKNNSFKTLKKRKYKKRYKIMN